MYGVASWPVRLFFHPKHRIERRAAVERVVDAAVDRRVPETRASHIQAEPAVRSHGGAEALQSDLTRDLVGVGARLLSVHVCASLAYVLLSCSAASSRQTDRIVRALFADAAVCHAIHRQYEVAHVSSANRRRRALPGENAPSKMISYLKY